MQISWLGLSSFEMNFKGAQGEVNLVIDPYDNEVGLRFPRTLQADLALVSHNKPEANNVEALQGAPFTIKNPGEFEVKGIFVYGIGAPSKESKEHTIYRIEAEDIAIAHLGALDRKLTDEELEGLKAIDILMIPVGGGNVLTPSVAVEVISQIEPRVVIPMTHAVEGVKAKLATVDMFCKELGACKREDLTKYKITRSALPEEDTIIVVLSRA